MASGNLLRLLGELLDGVGDAAGEPVDDERADHEKGDRHATPELREAPRLSFDAGEREPDLDAPDDFRALTRVRGSATCPDQDLLWTLAPLRHDGRHELDEALPGKLGHARKRAVDLPLSDPSLVSSQPTTAGQGPTVATVDDHVRDVGILERAPYRRLEKRLVLAEGSELAGEAKIRRQSAPPLLELVGDEPPMLADIHPPLEHEKEQDDGNDGPEDAGSEAREAAPRGPALPRHSMMLVARARTVGGISSPSFCAALRFTVRYHLRAFVYGTSVTGRPASIARADSPACRPMSSPLANESANSAPICAWRSVSPSSGIFRRKEIRSICWTTVWERTVSSGTSHSASIPSWSDSSAPIASLAVLISRVTSSRPSSRATTWARLTR